MGNGFGYLIVSLISYAFLGLLIVLFLLPLFPFLVGIVILGILIAVAMSVFNYIKLNIRRAVKEKKFDEYGHRKTNATVMEMSEAAKPQENPGPATENKNEK